MAGCTDNPTVKPTLSPEVKISKIMNGLNKGDIVLLQEKSGNYKVFLCQGDSVWEFIGTTKKEEQP